MENISIYQKLQKVRLEISKSNLKKSGKNSHLGFSYFELEDFLPKATELFDKYGLCPIFRIEVEPSGIEYAYMTIIDGNEQVIFKIPTAEPTGNNPIQMLGSKETYCRRYLYLAVLDLVENDGVEPSLDSNKKVEFATPGQIATIKTNGKLIAKELSEANVKTENDIRALTKVKAKEFIDLIETRKNEANV